MTEVTAQAPVTAAADMATLPDEVFVFRGALLLAQQLRYLFDRRLAADALTTSQAMALTVTRMLSRRDGAPSLGEVADGMATSHQNVAQLMRGLQAKGLVVVEADPRDRRVRRIRVTDRAEEYWAARDATDFAFLADLFDTGGDLAEFRSGLQALLERVNDVYRATRTGAD